MNRKLASLLILLMLALSTLACLPGGLLGGKEADQPPSAETSEPAAAAPTTPPEPTAALEPALAPVAMLGEEQRSDHGGFVFQTIPGYTLEEEFGFASIEAPDADPEVGPALLLMGGITEGSTSAEGLFDGFASDLEAGMEVSEPHEITVGGVSGLAADVSGTVEGKELVARVVFVAVTPTQSFNMFGVAPSDRWDSELAPLFDAVLASVSFFEPTQPGEAEGPASGSVAGIGEEIRQWATSATASSEYDNPDWAASQATGAPDTLECGDYPTAWAASDDDTVEWLELRYDVPVRPIEVNIVQSYSPDQVLFVDLLDTEGEYHDIYLGEPEDKSDQCPYTLSIPVEDADYQAVGVKITVDQSELGTSWNEIDAVELVGVSEVGAPSSAPASTPALAPAAELGDEHRNDFGGFAFQTIAGYTLEEEFGFVSMEAPDADPEFGPAILFMGGGTEEGRTAEELYDNLVSDIESGIEVSDPSEVTVGSVSGLAADMSGTLEGKEMAGRLVFVVVSPAQSLSVYGVAPSDRWEGELSPLFDAVLASVSFFEPTQPEEAEAPATPTPAPPTATPKPAVAQGSPCFDTRFERIEDTGGAIQEVRGHVYDLNEQPVKSAVVEIYVKGFWSQFNRQALTTDDGGFVFLDLGGSTDHEYILRVIGMPDGTPAYNTWEEIYTFKFETTHDRAVVFIYQVPFQADVCHLPNELQ